MAGSRAIAVTPRGLNRFGALLVCEALLVLLIAYVAICIHSGTAWPWNTVVHEDGKRTLLQTLLFYEHATRELPIDLLLGVAVGGAAYYAFPAQKHGEEGVAWFGFGLATLAVAGVIVGGAAAQGGMKTVLENLFQNHTRPGAPLVWGSHWRYHLLERGPMILMSLGFGTLLRRLTGREGRAGRIGLFVALGVVGAYLLLTAAFTTSRADLALPFFDPQYLGHESREIFTHALVTIPITWGGVLVLHRRSLPWLHSTRPLALGGLLVAAAVLLSGAGFSLYALMAAMASDAASHGQSTDIVTLICPHFFEHGFTYLVTPLCAAWVYGLCAAGGRASG